MSNNAHSTDAHGHAAPGGDHVPHVLPLKAYFGVFAALLVFTGITVGVSYLDLGSANLFIALLVATMKALMVGLIFMHLAFDKKFNAVVFSSAVIFLGIFISLTMFDTNWRHLGGRTSGERPADVNMPFGGTESEAAMRAKYDKTKAPAAAEAGEGEPAGAEGGEHH
jgi:cytochrome c oxidase subunit 4